MSLYPCAVHGYVSSASTKARNSVSICHPNGSYYTESTHTDKEIDKSLNSHIKPTDITELY